LQNDFNALRGGYISGVSADHIGRACLTMGAGRKRTDDTIDFAVGISDLAKIGDAVEPGQRLLTLHANDAFKLEDAERLVAQAFTYADEPVARTPLVAEQIG